MQSFSRMPCLLVLAVLMVLEAATARLLANPTSAPVRATPATLPTNEPLTADDVVVNRRSLTSTQLLEGLRVFSDAMLGEVLDRAWKSKDWDGDAFETILTETIRRGGPHWEAVLKARYQTQYANEINAALGPMNDRSRLFLTALRRVQKKDDPLAVLVSGKSEVHTVIGHLPSFDVNLTNLDVDRMPLFVETGGDYRGTSRHNKMSVQVLDAKGERVPVSRIVDMGGFLDYGPIKFRESVPCTLNLNAYISIERPGEYNVAVLYHPNKLIAHEGLDAGLIYHRSIPIKLVVAPYTIELSDAEQAKAVDLIGKLPRQEAVRILLGNLGPRDNDFMPRESPAGQLKEMGWKAVPALIESVGSDKLNATQRAWILGLLYGITEQNNPMEAVGVLGRFEYRINGQPLVDRGLQSLSAEAGAMLNGKIDEKAQLTFAKRWKAWLDNGCMKVVKVENKKKE